MENMATKSNNTNYKHQRLPYINWSSQKFPTFETSAWIKYQQGSPKPTNKY